jgi:hypothetical protein
MIVVLRPLIPSRRPVSRWIDIVAALAVSRLVPEINGAAISDRSENSEGSGHAVAGLEHVGVVPAAGLLPLPLDSFPYQHMI